MTEYEDFDPDDCECEDCEEYDQQLIAPEPLDWRSFVGIALVGIDKAVYELSSIVGTWGHLFLGSHNYRVAQRSIHAQMTAELESILSEEE